MKVLLLNWLDPENPQAGGAEVHLAESFGHLVESGWEITLIASGWKGAKGEAQVRGVRVLRVGGRLTYPLRAIPLARRLLATEGFDLVVEDLNKVPLFTPLWTRAPLLLLVHHLFGSTAFEEASPPLALVTWLLERPLAALYRGEAVVAVSESTRADLVARGFPEGSIEVVPNGVDLKRFRPGERGDRFPEPTLLYLGRLRRYKRVELLLESVVRLRAAGLPVRLLIAGRGARADALRARAKHLGLGEGVVTFLGFVSEEEKSELLRRCWVQVMSSRKEGWGLVNLEAAASGTPSVAMRVPGVRDSILDGVTGFLTPDGELEPFVERMRALLEDPELRERLGEGGVQFAQQFRWEESARQLGDRLRAAASRRSMGEGTPPSEGRG